MKSVSLKHQRSEQHLQLYIAFKICQNKVKKLTVGFLLSGFKLFIKSLYPLLQFNLFYNALKL